MATPPPVLADPASSFASTRLPAIVTVTCALAQLDGRAVSQMRYVSVSVPTRTPYATLTAPVAASSVTPALVEESCAMVTVPTVAGVPARLSFASTFSTAARAYGEFTEPESSCATMPVPPLPSARHMNSPRSDEAEFTLASGTSLMNGSAKNPDCIVALIALPE